MLTAYIFALVCLIDAADAPTIYQIGDSSLLRSELAEGRIRLQNSNEDSF